MTRRNTPSSVRVRIAPSPTGPLHVGLARTALFNVLFARSRGGTVLLRIEDTDQDRSRREYEEDIIRGLEWLGIRWDEEPVRQSDRTDHYRTAITSLIESKKAYRCFCTKEHIAQLRENAVREKRAYRYNGTCRNISFEESNTRALTESFVVRLRVDIQGSLSITDLIRGNVEFQAKVLDDFVLSRGEDMPLYHLSVVVDDAMQGVTHIIRGEDHISNTPKHVLLQQALGVPTPAYAHLPLILDSGGAKLSKRSPNVETLISAYREQGYVPEAVINTLALIGWNPKSDREIFSLTELIQEFKIEHVQKGGAMLSQERLRHMNRHHIQHLPASEVFQRSKIFLKKSGMLDIPHEQLIRGIMVEQGRITLLSELPAVLSFIRTIPDLAMEEISWKGMPPQETASIISYVLDFLENISEVMWDDREKLHREFLRMADESSYGRGEVLWPVRYGLCGKKNSPGPHELAWVLGREETMKRLKMTEKLLYGTMSQDT